MGNPFKYGVLVDNNYFIDSTKELQYIAQFLHSKNRLTLIGPRQHRKYSLVRTVVRAHQLAASNLRRGFLYHDYQGSLSIWTSRTALVI